MRAIVAGAIVQSNRYSVSMVGVDDDRRVRVGTREAKVVQERTQGSQYTFRLRDDVVSSEAPAPNRCTVCVGNEWRVRSVEMQEVVGGRFVSGVNHAPVVIEKVQVIEESILRGGTITAPKDAAEEPFLGVVDESLRRVGKDSEKRDVDQKCRLSSRHALRRGERHRNFKAGGEASQHGCDIGKRWTE